MLWALTLSEPMVRTMLSSIAVTYVSGAFWMQLAPVVRIQPFFSNCWFGMATKNLV